MGEVKSTHKPEDVNYPHLRGVHIYDIDGEVSVMVEDGTMTFSKNGEEVFTLSEWDHSEFDMAYVGDRIDQIVKDNRRD